MTADRWEVEKDWTTAAGFRAVVVMGSMGFRCGYVGLPQGHPLHGAAYGEPCAILDFPGDEPIGKRGLIPLICCNGEARPDVVFDVHGGLTYSGGREDYPAPNDGLWWFGYDCGHAGDGKTDEYLAEARTRWPDAPYMYTNNPGEYVRDLDYCIEECESLAAQIAQKVQP